MAEWPNSATWLPLPPPRAPRRRWLLLPLALLALAGMAATVVSWRADSADRQGDYARAVWWRPNVALYRRHLGESLLVNAPQPAERQLLVAERLDPYDPRTTADLTTAELALGNWNQAATVTRNQQRRESSFADHWRLANLLLTHGDLPGYWVQVELACRMADPDYFVSVISRSLTASNNDFNRLRAVLPAASVAAASADLDATLERDNDQAAHAGARWLLGLPPANNAFSLAARRQALLEYLVTAWQRWPAQASGVWTQLDRAGLLQGPFKSAHAPYLRNPGFNPRTAAAVRRIVADPSQPLSAILGWRWSNLKGVQFNPVYTGEARYPTAAEFTFDGTEADDGALPDQWLLANGGSVIQVSLAGRMLNPATAQGLSLQLLDMRHHRVAALPVTLSRQWGTTRGTFTIPGTGLQTFDLEFHYHRPSGQLPLDNSLLVSALRLVDR